MSLNSRIDESLEDIIRSNRKQQQQQQPKKKQQQREKAMKKVAKAKAPEPRKASRGTKNKGPGLSTDALAGRLGRGSGVSKVAGPGRLAGRIGKQPAKKAGISTAQLAGRAKAAAAPQPKAKLNISIKGEAGPAMVFISNLDMGASAEDVKTCFRQFGAVKDCTLLYDSSGKASGYAKVTYTSKVAAEEAASKLNNALADGRRLSVQLMPATKAQQSTAPFAVADAGKAAHAGARKGRKMRGNGSGRMDVD
ncbi:hypothetical protein GGF46_005327 [Coemansia sp. RSA 552]|nr:hypothetical protein GGF46_005327 [Coemansia sp. RSA 552]